MSKEEQTILVQQHIKTILATLNDARVTEFFGTIAHGKMMRAKLIMKIAAAHPDAPKLAAIVELIHLASLLHDDVIDDSLLRRGKPTVHALYGTKNAVMLGDILYAKAFEQLVGMGETIAQSVSGAVVQLSIGELNDVAMSSAFNEDEDAYMKMLYQKTGSLIEASCFAAAVLAGYDRDVLGSYGRALGVAFQIVDDILDVTQDEAKLGKPSFGDFAEGKSTLPFLYLYAKLSHDERIALLKLFGKPFSPEGISWTREQMAKHDIVKLCLQKASKVMDDAVCALEKSENVDAILRGSLIKAAQEQLARDF